MRPTFGSPGSWAYLYRAVDSTGEIIDFMLSPNRESNGGKALSAARLVGGQGDRSASHRCGWAPEEVRELGRPCRCRTSPHLNNIIEQDHRFIRKRIVASLGFKSAEGAWRTIEGYEAMHAIRKGQIRWLANGDAVAQRRFIHALFGIAE